MVISDEAVEAARKLHSELIGVDCTCEDVRKCDSGIAILEAFTALPHLQAQGWRDISTAPKDGDFLVWHRECVRQVCLYDGHSIIPKNTVIDATAGRMWVATHWMPLPAAPLIAEQREAGK